jgi:hypothetical protein
MGRQIQFHMLPEDCAHFLRYVQERDPVIVIPFTSKSRQLQEALSPCKGGWFCLWNQAISHSIEYQHVPQSKVGPHYRIDDSGPVLEFSPSSLETWNGRSALRQSRIYTGHTADKGSNFVRWFNALSGWIRRNYLSSPDKFIGGYVGPAALEWFKQGGLLLPMIYPPITPEWLAVFETQNNIRRALGGLAPR